MYEKLRIFLLKKVSDMKKYSHFFFDCDGVVLNSNHIKTKTFFKVALKYGEDKAAELESYHVSNGGISRYKKFKFFLENIIKNYNEIEYQNLLEEYGNLLKGSLIKADISKGIFQLKNYFPNTLSAIISGSDEKELRWLFNKRNISNIFNYGIYGSPKSKYEIFDKIYSQFNGSEKTLYFGDSKYDYLVSKNYEMDFIFISEWTELDNWENFTQKNNIKSFKNISNFLNSYD